MFFLRKNVRLAIDEAELVEEVIEALIASNGLSRLRWSVERGAATAATAAAASAFAVLLFQWKNSKSSKLLSENELHEWRPGVDFATDVATTLKVRNANIVDALFSSYGLLEQNHEPYRLLCVSTPNVQLSQMHNTPQSSSLCDV
jgi:hypothetical protein